MFKAGIHFDKDLWKKMMPYAMPLLLAGLAGMVNETLDRILLTGFHQINRKATNWYLWSLL